MGRIRAISKRLRRSESGQSITEYALAISVIVTAVVAAGWAFYSPLQEGSQQFGQQFETFYAQPGGPQ